MLSRLYGGIHVQVDDFQGRITGAQIGTQAYDLAHQYFMGVPEPDSFLMLSGMAIAMQVFRRGRFTNSTANILPRIAK